MQIQDLILPKKLLVAFSGIGIAMILGAFYSAYQQYDVDTTWLYVGIGLNLVSLIAVIIDLIKNPVHERLMWILFLATIPMLAVFVYLVGRDKFLGIKNQD